MSSGASRRGWVVWVCAATFQPRMVAGTSSQGAMDRLKSRVALVTSAAMVSGRAPTAAVRPSGRRLGTRLAGWSETESADTVRSPPGTRRSTPARSGKQCRRDSASVQHRGDEQLSAPECSSARGAGPVRPHRADAADRRQCVVAWPPGEAMPARASRFHLDRRRRHPPCGVVQRISTSKADVVGGVAGRPRPGEVLEPHIGIDLADQIGDQRRIRPGQAAGRCPNGPRGLKVRAGLAEQVGPETLDVDTAPTSAIGRSRAGRRGIRGGGRPG